MHLSETCRVPAPNNIMNTHMQTIDMTMGASLEMIVHSMCCDYPQLKTHVNMNAACVLHVYNVLHTHEQRVTHCAKPLGLQYTMHSNKHAFV